MHEFTHLDLFSGIGGFALAAQRAGFKTVGFSEVEPYACRVLDERFPGVPNIGDVTVAGSFARFWRGVTVCTAGYPCQPFSYSGKREGESDDRHLWPAASRVLEVSRPSWFIGENVSGHVTMGLDAVLSDLDRLGFASQPIIIPACAVGAWHIRERVWVLAYNEKNRRESRDLLAQGGTKQRASGEHRGRDRVDIHKSRRQTSARFKREPKLGRMVHGIPNRTHRLEGLGNAIVPQVVEPFFHWIRQIETGEINDTTFSP